MKVIILKEKLKKGLQIVERATSKSVSLPVLQNILFSTEKNFLNLASTDLEIGINWWNLAKIEKEGKFLIPAKIISQVINYFPEKPVTIEVKENFVNFLCENFSTNIKFVETEEFPIIPKPQAIFQVTLDSSVLIKNLKKIINFSSPSATRPEISGILFSFEKNLLKLVATDSFRLGEVRILLPKETQVDKKFEVIIPQKTAREIVTIFSQKEKELKLYLSQNQFSVESELEETPHPEILITSRVIEGEFPDYEAIIPKKFNCEILLSKEEFLKQIRAASIFSPKSREVILNILPKKEKIEIKSESPEVGSYSSSLPGKIKGKEMKISFNYQFLMEGIEKIEGKELFLLITSEEGPAMIKPSEKEDYCYILMPIKIS